jgi:lysozyme
VVDLYERGVGVTPEGREQLRLQIIRDEGCRLTLYDDPLGIPTIGAGRNLRDRGISQAEAEILLDNDIRQSTSDVLAHVPWAFRLDEVRLGVLVAMAFNLGIGGLVKFEKALAAMERGDWYTAAAHMMDSKWARQIGLRAERLAEQMRDGAWR